MSGKKRVKIFWFFFTKKNHPASQPTSGIAPPEDARLRGDDGCASPLPAEAAKRHMPAPLTPRNTWRGC
jgi:hypothetical protein